MELNNGKCCKVTELLGKTLFKIEKNESDDKLLFICEDGSKYSMFHEQECCEDVYIDDICGELSDLIGYPILQAEESTNVDENPEGLDKNKRQQDGFTWTFYKFRTIKGGVTIRWYGTSNGCYAEKADFKKIA